MRLPRSVQTTVRSLVSALPTVTKRSSSGPWDPSSQPYAAGSSNTARAVSKLTQRSRLFLAAYASPHSNA
jgi:hypothetical protein